MARPKCCRHIFQKPSISAFIPDKIAQPDEAPLQLSLDEWEAIRLSDLEKLYQEDAARVMSVSRQTYARIIDSAHLKIAQALVFGKPLAIDGGRVQYCGGRKTCPFCPKLKSQDIDNNPASGHCPACGQHTHPSGGNIA